MKNNKNKCQAGRDNAQPNAIKEVGRFMLDTLEFVLAVIAIVGIIYLIFTTGIVTELQWIVLIPAFRCIYKYFKV